MGSFFKLKVGGVPEHFNLPWHIAIEEGEFALQNIDVDWVDCPAGTGDMLAKLKSKELDIAVVLLEGAVKSIASGTSIKIIQEYVKSPLIWGVHTYADSLAQSFDDIEEYNYAISRYGSGSHLMAFVQADAAQIDSKKLRFNVINTLEGALTSLNDKSSNLFLWEKFTTKPYVDKGLLKRIGEVPTPWPCFVIVARNETIINHHDELNNMLDIINARCKIIMEDANIFEVFAERYDLELSDVREWFEQTEWSTKKVVSKKGLQSCIEKLSELRLLEQHLPAEKLCGKWTKVE